MIGKLEQIYIEGFSEDGENYSKYFCEKNIEFAVVYPKLNPVSAGYVIPKKLFNGKYCAYFSALATLREERGKGNAAALINKMLVKASKDYAFAVLSPFNSEFYKKFGFFTTQYCTKSVVEGNEKYDLRLAKVEDLDCINNLFSKSVRPIIDEEYLVALQEETAMYNAVPVVVIKDDKIVGFCVKEKSSLSRVLTKEIAIDKVGNFNGYTYKKNSVECDAFIQLRILSVVDFAKYLKAKRDFNIKIKVVDEIIFENNFVFEFNSVGTNLCVKMTENPHTVEVKIERLVEYLVENDYIEKFETQFIDEY